MDESLYRGFDERAQSFFNALEGIIDITSPERPTLRKHLTDEVHRVLHLGKKDENELRKGFNIAFYAYRGIQRRSGEAYVFHVVRGVLIMTWALERHGVRDLGLLLTLFLHDAYEETDKQWYQQLLIRSLVNIRSGIRVGTGVHHLTRKEGESDEEYFLRLLACGDWRVILAKFVDRIDNLRTMGKESARRRNRKIEETEKWFHKLQGVLVDLLQKEFEAGRLEEEWLKVARFLIGYLWYTVAELKRLHPT
jgi:(p)ppGpp synthase/HD superfamily hydrolase